MVVPPVFPIFYLEPYSKMSRPYIPSSLLESKLMTAAKHICEASEPFDYDREGLRDTPTRVAQAWRFWTSGYDKDPTDIFKCFEDGSQNYDELIFVGGCELYSHCEHHLAPFFGVAHVGYIPKGKIIGLSKIPRLIDVFARRLQVQERLTTQITEAIWTHLNPIAVGVVLRCRHLCMESRGVQKPGTITYTSKLLGAFKEKPESRAEFLEYVKLADQRTGAI